MKNLDNYVKAIPDFPKPGILFRDVTGILESPDGFQLSLDKAVGILADVACRPLQDCVRADQEAREAPSRDDFRVL